MIRGADDYNYPLTLEIVGIKDILLGIKVSIYYCAD